MGPTTPPANDSRRELFSMMPLEPSRDRGPIDAITDPSKAQARATAALKAEAAHRIACLRERREEIQPLHEASLEEAGLRALVGEGRGSSLGLLRLENSLDLALHRALKRIDALRKQGRISPPRSTQVPEPAKACTKCENEPQAGRSKAPAAPSAPKEGLGVTVHRMVQPSRSSRSRRRDRARGHRAPTPSGSSSSSGEVKG
jgi:hypothetical protein